MSLNTRRITRTSQPQELVKASGSLLQRRFHWTSGNAIASQSNELPSFDNTARVVTSHGLGGNFNGTSQYAKFAADELSRTINGGRFFALAVGATLPTGTLYCSNAAGGLQLRIAAGAFEVLRSGSALLLSAVAGLKLNSFNCVGYVWDGFVIRLFANGRLIGSVANTTAFASPAYESIGQRGAGTEYYSGVMLDQLGTYGPLSDFEGRSLSGNPWQLFEPINETLWIPETAAGGSAITSAAGTSTTSALTAQSTASAAATSATGTSTASSIAAISTAASTATAADGTSTASTLAASAGASAITPSAGVSVAGSLTGASVAASVPASATGATTASVTAQSTAASVPTSATGTTTAGMLMGSAAVNASMTPASGATTASAFASSAVAASVAIASAGASSAATLATNGLLVVAGAMAGNRPAVDGYRQERLQASGRSSRNQSGTRAAR